MVLLWSSEAFPMGGSVVGASHARQRPMRTLQLHRKKKSYTIITSRVPIRKKEFGSRYDEIMMKPMM